MVSDENIFELAIEAGADECKSNNDYHEIQCEINEIYNVKKELEKKINNFISTEIEWIPLNSIKISKDKNEDLINFFESLEEDDDVQNIYSNAEFIKINMLIIGIDPGISGSICFFDDGKILDVIEMPTMTDGKKIKNKLMVHKFIMKFQKELIKIEKQK